ncbi:hypothetical protein PISMIDRAFT_435929 [Pisolithus microcarpus 441]|uniref:Uncharacterized protein n=1 Tax=Pisolithus microcarpus 441 TaxID=765257 RepID=A0A0C9Z3M9_9AGAM|nr:hypothetical protein PISMIDRAFT_435929 [Pisolithus microcarpus 441]
MVNFAELKAKAEKAKDAGVAKVVNTKDRYSSISSSKTTWDPNWKRGTPRSSTSSPPSQPQPPPPPPPPPPRSTVAQSRGAVVGTDEPSSSGISPRDAVAPKPPPVVSRASRPDIPGSPTPSHTSKLPPPPKRFSSGYPPSHNRANSHGDTTFDKIDWVNLSTEDKEEFFRWLDEFFSRYLNVEMGPRTSVVSSPPPPAEASVPIPATRSGPPPVNTATRPRIP